MAKRPEVLPEASKLQAPVGCYGSYTTTHSPLPVGKRSVVGNENGNKLRRESNNAEMHRNDRGSQRWSNSGLSCLFLVGKLWSMISGKEVPCHWRRRGSLRFALLWSPSLLVMSMPCGKSSFTAKVLLFTTPSAQWSTLCV